MNDVKTGINEVTGINEAFLPATLTRMPSDFERKNSNDSEYGIIEASVVYPDNTEEKVNGIMYKGSFDTGLFEVGGSVELRVQLEGEYAGNAVVQLPSTRKVDITKLVGAMAPAKVAVKA